MDIWEAKHRAMRSARFFAALSVYVAANLIWCVMTESYVAASINAVSLLIAVLGGVFAYWVAVARI